jgi:hypothetical protein
MPGNVPKWQGTIVEKVKTTGASVGALRAA